MATWIGGMFFASLGSPAAIPLLSQTVTSEHFPTVKEGLFLEDRQSHMLSALQYESGQFRFTYVRVDNSVRNDPSGYEAGQRGYSDVLKRASVEMRGEKVWLTQERAGDEVRALVVLDAERGNADFLDYETNGCLVYQRVEGENQVILVAMAPGEKITAVRSNWRWLNLLGFRSRKTMERIDITFDGMNISLSNSTSR